MRTTFINGIFCLLLFDALFLIELGSNDNFLHKLVKRHEDDIGSILKSGQSNLVLNVESEFQILIGFQHIVLVHTDCKIAIAVQSRPSLTSW